MYIITARKNLNQVIPVNILQYCVAHILKNATQVFFFFCWRLVGDTVFSKETFAHIQSGKSMFCCQLGKMKWQPTPVFLPGKSHGQRSLAGYSSWGCKKSDMTERLHFHFHNTYKNHSKCSEDVDLLQMCMLTHREVLI